VDALRELHDPDVIMRPVKDWPEQGPYIGRGTVMRFLEQLRNTWDAERLEPTSLTDIEDRVAVKFIWHGAGQGPQMNLEMTDVFTVRKSRILGHEFFWDHAEALEAAGLSD
jgi:ketosteroid isomerase-like protein